MQTLIVLNDHTKAHMLKGVLESEGIDSYIFNENLTAAMPGYVGMIGADIKVMVDDRDLERAHAIMLEYFPQWKEGEPVTCPECGSKDLTNGVSDGKALKILGAILSWIMATPMANIQGQLRCRQCGAKF